MTDNKVIQIDFSKKFKTSPNDELVPIAQYVCEILTEKKIKHNIVSPGSLLVNIGGLSFFFCSSLMSNGGYTYYTQNVNPTGPLDLSKLQDFAKVYTLLDMETHFEVRSEEVKFNFEMHLNFDEVQESENIVGKLKQFARSLSRAIVYCEKYGFEIGGAEPVVFQN